MFAAKFGYRFVYSSDTLEMDYKSISSIHAATLSVHLQSLEETVAPLQTASREQKSTIDTLQTEKASLEAANERWRERTNHQVSSLQDMEQQLREAKDKHVASQQRISELNAKIKDKDEEIQQVKTDYEAKLTAQMPDKVPCSLARLRDYNIPGKGE